METKNVLSDYMDVGRPVFSEIIAVFAAVVAERGYIVGERVYPDVNNVLIVERHGNSPIKAAPGHAEVLESRLQEVVDHLFLSGLGAYEVGVLLDMLHKSVLILAHPEEVRFLALFVDFASAVGAFPVYELSVRPERFAGRAVPALVLALVYVALVVELLEYLLDRRLVVVVRGAYKFVVAGVHKIPDTLYLGGHAVYVFLGRRPRRFGQFLDLLSVLVGAGAEENVVAHIASEPRDGVGQDYLVGVAYMRLARRVGYRRRDIVFTFFFVWHCYPLLVSFVCELFYNRRLIYSKGRR